MGILHMEYFWIDSIYIYIMVHLCGTSPCLHGVEKMEVFVVMACPCYKDSQKAQRSGY